MKNTKIWEKRNILMNVAIIFQYITMIGLMTLFFVIVSGVVPAYISGEFKKYGNFTTVDKIQFMIIFGIILSLTIAGLVQAYRFKSKMDQYKRVSVVLPITILFLNLIPGIIFVLVWDAKYGAKKMVVKQ